MTIAASPEASAAWAPHPARGEPLPSAVALTLNVATMDGFRDPALYPRGDYRLRFFNQGARWENDTPPGVVNLDSRGLSRSRNAALDQAQDGIQLIGDNDVRYLPGFEHTIRRAYAEQPGADMVLFAIRTPEGDPFGRYPARPRPLKRLDVLHRCSIEISFRIAPIRRAGIRFDERFGLGAEFRTGEDIIFLEDARRAGLQIHLSMEAIGVHPRASSGASHSARLFADKGAMFARMYGWPGTLVAAAYAWRKRSAGVPAIGAGGALRAAVGGAVRFVREGGR